MRAAVVFPGQGSQGVGMGCDIAAHSPAARAAFERATVLLGYDLLALQRGGPEETLRETQFSQPAIFTTNLALYAAVGPQLAPVVTAGHSFAELCSLEFPMRSHSTTRCASSASEARRCRRQRSASRRHVGDSRPRGARGA